MIDFGGNPYDDWRLPSTVDGPYTWGYDGTTTAGYNITSSEMGYLFYTALGNVGAYDTSGDPTGCPGSPTWCLTNTGDFQNLLPNVYWSGTDAEYGDDPNYPNSAWLFSFDEGVQGTGNKEYSDAYGLAVRDGLAVMPEPVSSILFVTGATTLGLRRYWKKKKTAYS